MLPFDELIALPYHEFVEEALKDGPHDCTWYNKSNWVEDTYTPRQIALMSLRCYEKLVELRAGDQDEDQEADSVRDDADIFWYAGDYNLIEEVIDDFMKKEEKMQ
jgi:hypothetical protein